MRRPTRDIDFQGAAIHTEEEEIKTLVNSIITIELDDGLTFDSESITTALIREHGEYPGIRVSLLASLSSARLHFHVDINTGDPVLPPAISLQYPQILGGKLTLLGYPPTIVLGEKIVTAISRGTVNTRWRDFADILVLSKTLPIVGDDLQQSISAIADYRDVALEPLRLILEGSPLLLRETGAFGEGSNVSKRDYPMHSKKS